MVAEFKAAYGGEQPVTQENASHAIVSFEKSLVTPSRFDDWLKGDDQAITAQEKHGYHKFKAYGCAACHARHQRGRQHLHEAGPGRATTSPSARRRAVAPSSTPTRAASP